MPVFFFIVHSRQLSEENDRDCHDSSSNKSSNGSSDYGNKKGLKDSSTWISNQTNQSLSKSYASEKQGHKQQLSSSNDSCFGNSQGYLIFEFLEQDPPFTREPLAGKACFLSYHNSQILF